MVEPGRRRLGDRYELQELIAAGGMGQVWRGLDVALHRPVAVKVLRSEYTGDPSFVARFRAEAQHAAGLNHPGIAAVYDYGEETARDGSGETLAYLVMELVQGEPLSALLHREGRLDADRTLSLLGQTAAALAEAHRTGLVHRDVKPGNILVRPDGTVKITDFGIAWSARGVALTRTGQVIGTPQYLSPEQAEGRHATPASDVYALGLIGYECLTGHPAFEGDNAVTIALKQVQQEPEPLPGELPPGVRTLISRALVKDPGARFPDGASFAVAVAAVRAGRRPDSGTVTVDAVPRRRRPGRGRPAGASSPSGRPGARAAHPPVPRRRGRLAVVLLPLIGLLAGAAITATLLQALTQGGTPSTAAAAEERIDGSIVLEEADFLGRPVGEVAERLADLGLTVTVRAEVRDDVDPDAVTGVEPAGRPLRAGERVLVRYAASPEQRDGPRAPAVTGAADRAGTSHAAPTTEAPAPTTRSDTGTGSGTETGTGTGTGTGSGTGTGTGTPTGTTTPSLPGSPAPTSTGTEPVPTTTPTATTTPSETSASPTSGSTSPATEQ
ncbi:MULTISPECIES: protein kinase [unclassified Blastococcus]|uniref:protein kinase domain-containing protein n=1 Tax=unclassified Blastococcus TaxID=2619396 RepID=UPI0027E1FC2E|nr:MULTISPECIES: protein kinase [unclassified Blastococcus]